MKPQQKVVTAQDIQSSLYYLHVASPDDYELLQNDEQKEKPTGNHHYTQPVASDKISVARKPVPRNPNLDSSNRSALPELADPHPQGRLDGSIGNVQTSIDPDEGLTNGHRSLDLGPRLPPRKLLGPRSMNSPLHSVHNPTLQNVPGRQNIDMRRWSEQPATKPPLLPPRPSQLYNRDLYGSFRKDESTKVAERPTKKQIAAKNGTRPTEHCWEWENSWRAERASEAGAEMAEIASGWLNSRKSFEDVSDFAQGAPLSLIRRYNEEQWNVAAINYTSQEQPSGAATKLRGEISVEMLTPGYTKFVDSNRQQSSPREPAQKVSGDEGGKPRFRRNLQVYSNGKNHSTAPSTASNRPRVADAQDMLGLESQRQSSDSFGGSSTGSSRQKQTASSSSKYFMGSPWDGVCEFSTSIAGRSLKCKHTYPSTDPSYGPGTFSPTVSDLRFNLPSLKALGTPASKSPETSRGGKRSSFFLRSHRRRTSSFERNQIHDGEFSSTTFEHEDRLDLSLGQEHAGGGFGGKEAKLGKLIVEAEGLQMLDLVVAANMALWWRVYEKVT